MPIPDQASVEAIGSAMVKVVPEGWAKAVLTVSAVAATMETQLAVEMLDGSVDAGLSIDVDAQMACDDLRDAMYDDGKGTWYNAVFSARPGGRFEAEFDYDNPPFQGGGERDLLEDDQRAYPRDAAHLPVWHPSRAGLSGE
ncbi:hypothetical protein EV645_0378 [Kribbella rubisoli]|uniref:DUF600 family protein n=1 Tax=Kribbella rubisoli TaxID=3075929 RepID=A0A4Q7XFI3_9ACTN|nr:hypothetical protein [Kribbella rubisoli]RZU22297.1 hypothetical protein EV645_0378 [Kribbella rubisoli]